LSETATGGGGTFGVVTEATYLVAERKPVQAFVISSQRDPVFFKQVWTTYIANAERWANEGWGGRVTADLVLLLNQAINSTQAVSSMTVRILPICLIVILTIA
jgi:hypothetical protein